MEPEGTDKLDKMILDVIADNARLGYTEIGKAVGLSRVSVKNRIENMEKKGIIKGYKTQINTVAVSGGIQFFLDIDTFPENHEDFAKTLSRDSRIRKVYSMTGSCRLHAIGYAPTSADVGNFARYLYKNTKGARRIEWNIVAATFYDVDGGVDDVVREYNGVEHMEGGQPGIS